VVEDGTEQGAGGKFEGIGGVEDLTVAFGKAVFEFAAVGEGFETGTRGGDVGGEFAALLLGVLEGKGGVGELVFEGLKGLGEFGLGVVEAEELRHVFGAGGVERGEGGVELVVLGGEAFALEALGVVGGFEFGELGLDLRGAAFALEGFIAEDLEFAASMFDGGAVLVVVGLEFVEKFGGGFVAFGGVGELRGEGVALFFEERDLTVVFLYFAGVAL